MTTGHKHYKTNHTPHTLTHKATGQTLPCTYIHHAQQAQNALRALHANYAHTRLCPYGTCAHVESPEELQVVAQGPHEVNHGLIDVLRRPSGGTVSTPTPNAGMVTHAGAAQLPPSHTGQHRTDQTQRLSSTCHTPGYLSLREHGTGAVVPLCDTVGVQSARLWGPCNALVAVGGGGRRVCSARRGVVAVGVGDPTHAVGTSGLATRTHTQHIHTPSIYTRPCSHPYLTVVAGVRVVDVAAGEHGGTGRDALGAVGVVPDEVHTRTSKLLDAHKLQSALVPASVNENLSTPGNSREAWGGGVGGGGGSRRVSDVWDLAGCNRIQTKRGDHQLVEVAGLVGWVQQPAIEAVALQPNDVGRTGKRGTGAQGKDQGHLKNHAPAGHESGISCKTALSTGAFYAYAYFLSSRRRRELLTGWPQHSQNKARLALSVECANPGSTPTLCCTPSSVTCQHGMVQLGPRC